MVERESNGKTEKPLVPEIDPKATDWSAGATAKPLPIIGRVSTMPERPRERHETQPQPSGRGFFIDIESLFKMIGTAIAIAAAWYSLKSDLRDMNTKMDVQAAQVRELKAEQKLQQLTVNDIQLALARAGLLGTSPQITIEGRPAPERNEP